MVANFFFISFAQFQKTNYLCTRKKSILLKTSDEIYAYPPRCNHSSNMRWSV